MNKTLNDFPIGCKVRITKTIPVPVGGIAWGMMPSCLNVKGAEFIVTGHKFAADVILDNLTRWSVSIERLERVDALDMDEPYIFTGAVDAPQGMVLEIVENGRTPKNAIFHYILPLFGDLYGFDAESRKWRRVADDERDGTWLTNIPNGEEWAFNSHYREAFTYPSLPPLLAAGVKRAIEEQA
ncbi:hypothetical protein AXI70_gp09 [Cronobacter phage Dev-CD-23823]|uniref:Uncharacterized protein n=1 Tax=Cronobacter phage Dev-CD-23823 TaxID=1712539 RepID=A0A0K8IXA6_9CAUD|nr:hypothetical protein AXI70_gp09 [Cronobacter phage Dev-CD-23823]CUH74584.1 hypothetical protein [Cronobacter phage Dev-CD-23823]